jgi:glycosyltransferase involved in cell wall biosynthesis
VAYRDFAIANSRLPLIASLQDSGYQVVVAAEVGGYRGELEAAGARVERLPFTRGGFTLAGDGRATLRLVSILLRCRPELVHLFNGKPVLLGNVAALCRPQGTVISTITGLGYDPGANGLMAEGLAATYRLVGRRSSAVIFQNRDDRRHFIDSGWVRPEKAHLIVSSGVDIERFKVATPSPGAQQEGVTVLMLARLTQQKGVGEFLEAARSVGQGHPEVEFVLGGEWSSHPDSIGEGVVRRAVERRDIRFVGYVSNMPARLQAADVFVFPSYYREGVPRVLLEAAACGLPIVAADVPGSREVVRDGETGFLVPARDSQALADAIVRLSRDGGLRDKLGRAGREMVERHFDLEAITRCQLEVYREVGGFHPRS